MAQRFHRRTGVAKSIRHIATAYLDEAVAAIREPGGDEAEVIHDVRQRLKRLRALIRLPRDHFADYPWENAAFRDLGRKLAHSRDADVLQQTVEKLAERADIGDVSVLRAELTASIASGGHPDVRKLLQGDLTAGLLAARRRAEGWSFASRGFPLLGDGLRRVYAQMQASEKLARHQPNAANFHEWRKQVKYHANQLALFKPVAPDVISNYHDIGSKLGDVLGDHHDLDVLAQAAKSISAVQSTPLLEAINNRNAELETQAFRLGDELTTERPADFLRRIETGWDKWRAS